MERYNFINYWDIRFKKDMLDLMSKSFTMLHKQSLASPDSIFLISLESWQNTVWNKKESFFQLVSWWYLVCHEISSLKLNHSLLWRLRWLEIKINHHGRRISYTYVYGHKKSQELATHTMLQNLNQQTWSDKSDLKLHSWQKF